MAFQRAERRRVALKLAIDGPSGGGKTYSALRLARGMVGPAGRIAMIDTENGSGSLYAHLTEYDAMEIRAPFTVQKYLAGIRDAAEGQYDVLIIDSLSHEWDGEGGLLDQKLTLDKRGGNSFTNWADISKQHKEFTAQLLQSPLHIIATMRSKMEYEVRKDDKGKSSPTKLGLAPIQRDGMEYEFTVVFDVTADHTAAVSKDRTGLFAGLCSTLTEAHGKLLRDWLEGGAEPLPEPERRQEAPAPAATPQAATPQAATPPESRGDAAANGATDPEKARKAFFAAFNERWPKSSDPLRYAILSELIGKPISGTGDWTPRHYNAAAGKIRDLDADTVRELLGRAQDRLQEPPHAADGTPGLDADPFDPSTDATPRYAEKAGHAR